MKKGYVIASVLGVIVVVLAAGAWALAGMGADEGEVEYVSKTYTVETGAGWPIRSPAEAYNETGAPFPATTTFYPVTTFVNLTIFVQNKNHDLKEFNLTVIVHDPQTGYDFSRDTPEIYKIDGDSAKAVLYIVEIPFKIDVDNHMISIYIDGEKVG